MNETIEISAFAPEDLGPAAALERRCFSDPWSEDSLREEALAPNEIALAAHADGVLAGYLLLKLVVDEGEINNVAVAPERRRRGLARAMMAEALRRAAAKGARRLFLEVRQTNAEARRLYASFGFAEYSARPRYYRNPVEDAILMKKELEAPV